MRPINTAKYVPKAPKLRVRPGEYYRVTSSRCKIATLGYAVGQLFEVIYAFRLKDAPNEWYVCLEQRDLPIGPTLRGPVSAALFVMQSRSEIGKMSRVKYECFFSSMDADTYFLDIPAFGNRLTVPVKDVYELTNVPVNTLELQKR